MKNVFLQITSESDGLKKLYYFIFSGHYMYIETSSPRVQGDLARLSSPAFTFRGATCITFFYHMYGATTGRLEVTVNGRNVFSANGNKGKSWLEASINLNLQGNYPVRNISIVVKLVVARGKMTCAADCSINFTCAVLVLKLFVSTPWAFIVDKLGVKMIINELQTR